MITGKQVEQTELSATAFSTISGPMPAGSPSVIPTRGLSGLPGTRVTKVHCGEGDESGVTLIAGLFFRRFLHVILARVVAIFGIFGLIHVLDVVLQHEQVRPFGAMQLNATTVIPLDAPSELFAIL